MINVSIRLKDYQNLGSIFIDKMVFLGFKLSDRNTILDLYFILNNTIESERFMVKTSFMLDKENIDKEMAYLNHPLQSLLYIDRMVPAQRKNIQSLILNEINANNSYYCDFRPIDIINDLYIFNMIQTSLDGKQRVKQLSINFKDYFRIETIRNKLIFKLPLNPSIDHDPTFFNINTFKDVKITLLGINKVDVNFVTFLKLVMEKHRPVGLLLPVQGIVGKQPIPRNEYDTNKFVEFYPDNFMVNIDRFNIVYIKDKEGNITNRMSILRKYMDNKRVDLYILDEDPLNDILLNPYKLIYF